MTTPEHNFTDGPADGNDPIIPVPLSILTSMHERLGAMQHDLDTMHTQLGSIILHGGVTGNTGEISRTDSLKVGTVAAEATAAHPTNAELAYGIRIAARPTYNGVSSASESQGLRWTVSTPHGRHRFKVVPTPSGDTAVVAGFSVETAERGLIDGTEKVVNHSTIAARFIGGALVHLRRDVYTTGTNRLNPRRESRHTDIVNIVGPTEEVVYAHGETEKKCNTYEYDANRGLFVHNGRIKPKHDNKTLAVSTFHSAVTRILAAVPLPSQP